MVPSYCQSLLARLDVPYLGSKRPGRGQLRRGRQRGGCFRKQIRQTDLQRALARNCPVLIELRPTSSPAVPDGGVNTKSTSPSPPKSQRFAQICHDARRSPWPFPTYAPGLNLLMLSSSGSPPTVPAFSIAAPPSNKMYPVRRVGVLDLAGGRQVGHRRRRLQALLLSHQDRRA